MWKRNSFFLPVLISGLCLIPTGRATAQASTQLTIIRSGTNVVLKWPSTNAGFTLQSTLNSGAAVWNPVSQTPVVVNNQNTVTNPISGTHQFYRLSFIPPAAGWDTYAAMPDSVNTGTNYPTLTRITNYCYSLTTSAVPSYVRGNFTVMLDDGAMDGQLDANSLVQLNRTNFPGGGSNLVTQIHSFGMKASIFITDGGASNEGLPMPNAGATNNLELNISNMVANWKVDGIRCDPLGTETYQHLCAVMQRIATAAYSNSPSNQQLYFWAQGGYSNSPPSLVQINTLPRNTSIAYGFYPGAPGNTDYMDSWNLAAAMATNFPIKTQSGLQNTSPGWPNNEYWYPQGQNNIGIDVIFATALICDFPPGVGKINGEPAYNAWNTPYLLNSEIWAIDQDPLLLVGQKIPNLGSPTTDSVYVKPLVDGSVAAFFYNANPDVPRTITVNLSQLGFATNKQVLVRDVLNQTNFGIISDSFTFNSIVISNAAQVPYRSLNANWDETNTLDGLVRFIPVSPTTVTDPTYSWTLGTGGDRYTITLSDATVGAKIYHTSSSAKTVAEPALPWTGGTAYGAPFVRNVTPYPQTIWIQARKTGLAPSNLIQIILPAKGSWEGSGSG
jgi:hypothetical protein